MEINSSVLDVCVDLNEKQQDIVDLVSDDEEIEETEKNKKVPETLRQLFAAFRDQFLSQIKTEIQEESEDEIDGSVKTWDNVYIVERQAKTGEDFSKMKEDMVTKEAAKNIEQDVVQTSRDPLQRLVHLVTEITHEYIIKEELFDNEDASFHHEIVDKDLDVFQLERPVIIDTVGKSSRNEISDRESSGFQLNRSLVADTLGKASRNGINDKKSHVDKLVARCRRKSSQRRKHNGKCNVFELDKHVVVDTLEKSSRNGINHKDFHVDKPVAACPPRKNSRRKKTNSECSHFQLDRPVVMNTFRKSSRNGIRDKEYNVFQLDKTLVTDTLGKSFKNGVNNKKYSGCQLNRPLVADTLRKVSRNEINDKYFHVDKPVAKCSQKKSSRRKKNKDCRVSY